MYRWENERYVRISVSIFVFLAAETHHRSTAKTCRCLVNCSSNIFKMRGIYSLPLTRLQFTVADWPLIQPPGRSQSFRSRHVSMQVALRLHVCLVPSWTFANRCYESSLQVFDQSSFNKSSWLAPNVTFCMWKDEAWFWLGLSW